MDSIINTNTSFSVIAFFDEDNQEEAIMELQGTRGACDLGMRVPFIGELVRLASYKGDFVNDKTSIFQKYYKVVDVISSYSENRKWDNISVQYSVILRRLQG